MNAALFLAGLLAAPAALATPILWTDRYAKANCLLHPDTNYRFHKPPKPDTTATFTLAGADGKLTDTVCPGMNYTVGLALPSNVFRAGFLMTSTAGEFFDPNFIDYIYQGSVCLNRAVHYASKGPFSVKLKLPCDISSESVQIRLTWASGSSDFFHQMSSTPKIGNNLQCNSCGTVENAAPPPEYFPPTYGGYLPLAAPPPDESAPPPNEYPPPRPKQKQPPTPVKKAPPKK